MRLSRRLKQLEMRESAVCPCQLRQIEIIDLTHLEAPPADNEPEPGPCPRCGRLPPISKILLVRSEWYWSSDSTQEPLGER
jgi:hypothetical protein